MLFRSLVVALASLPVVALGSTNFDGAYSVAVGPGPLTDLYIMSVKGPGGTMTLAKPFQKPFPARAINIEQDASRMKVTSDEDKNLKLVFEKSDKGLACIEGCNAYSRNWEDIKLAKEAKAKNVSPAAGVDFDSLPAVDIGNIDGAWIQSKTDQSNANDTAYEIKGEFVKRYYYTYGLYPKSSTPDVLMISGESFIFPRTGSKVFQLRRVSDTKLVARVPKTGEKLFLYRADSINFADLKKARSAAESKI